jgi:hypothetical protein
VSAELEAALSQISGVHSARVVGDPPQEIHLVTTKERTPKQLVRDVQSLANASFGIAIDHRIVSVVQLDRNAGVQSPSRPLLNHVVIGSSPRGTRIDVELKWPDGKTTNGGASAGTTRDERLRATAEAVVEALRPALEGERIDLTLSGASAQETGDGIVVVVRLKWTDRRETIPLIGAALLGDDLVVGATRAVLDAVNRKLTLAFGSSVDKPR